MQENIQRDSERFSVQYNNRVLGCMALCLPTNIALVGRSRDKKIIAVLKCVRTCVTLYTGNLYQEQNHRGSTDGAAVLWLKKSANASSIKDIHATCSE